MQVSENKNKTRKVNKSQILIIGSLLIFIGVVCLSYNHIMALKNSLVDEVRLKLLVESPQDIVTDSGDISNINGDNNGSSAPEVKKNYNYLGYLEVPKVKLVRGFLPKGSKYNNVDYNVTISYAADYPDVKKGNFILMAHSGDAYISYFAYLHKLKIGDKAYVTYKDVKYKYKLVNIEEQSKTGTIAIHRLNYKVNALTLITCTKDNDTAQTIYVFELV